MKKLILLPLLVYAVSAHAQPAPAAANTPAPFLPIKPAELITDMPPAPIGWTMLSSLAVNDFTSGWITAYADRNFKKNPPPPIPGVPAVPLPPVTMNVHLTDTGYKNDFTNIVTPPKAGAPSNATYLQIHDFPARMLKLDDKITILNFLVKNRFLFEIRTVNLPDDKLQKIAEAIDCSKLLAAPDTGETKVSDPVILSRVDEFHPQNTRSYPLYWSVAPKSK